MTSEEAYIEILEHLKRIEDLLEVLREEKE